MVALRKVKLSFDWQSMNGPKPLQYCESDLGKTFQD